MMQSVEEQLYANVLRHPDKVALVSGDTEVRYAQLWQQSLVAAANLKGRYGLRQGDRVILAASGSVEFVYAYVGVHMAGGVCVPIDPDTNETRFGHIKRSTQPLLVMGTLHKVEHEEAMPFAEVLREVPAQTTDEVKFPHMDDISDILFTTGTTGAPKGVALSYKNQAAAALNINTFIGNTTDDTELLALPVSHSFGLGRVRCVLAKGGTLVMLGTFANMKRFFGEMQRCRVMGFGMVPASWGYIKKMSGKYIGKFADQLRYIEIGSSFMPTADKELLMQLLPNTRICMHYGSTEASRSAFMEFHQCRDNLTTAGQASPNCEIKVFSPQGCALPAGVEGEVCVKGDHVTCGYWNEPPERYAADFYDGYFRTGDSGVMDAEGNVYLKSRIKEIINVGGKKVAPMEVEDILNTIPGIADSACIGVPDPDGVLGEVVKAFIVEERPVADAEIIDYLRPRIETYKLPAAFERIAEIPKTKSGKIQRLSLKK